MASSSAGSQSPIAVRATGSSAQVVLESADGLLIDVSTDVIRMSSVLMGFEGEDEVIPVPNVSGRILQIIIEWCLHHMDDPSPAAVAEDSKPKNRLRYEPPKRSDDIPEWDQEYLKVLDSPTLFELINAVHYLDIKPFEEILCKTVANIIKNRSCEDICRAFNLKTRISARNKRLGKRR